MTTDLGPVLPRGATDRRQRQLSVRAHAGRWNESPGARLLVVDAAGRLAGALNSNDLMRAKVI